MVEPPKVDEPRVEDKLFYNRYLVDAGRPHVKIKAHDRALARAARLDQDLPGALL